jgi:hypothetical protein
MSHRGQRSHGCPLFLGGLNRSTTPRTSNASAELLGQRDDDALWPADVAEPIGVLVLLQLANEFGAMGMQAGKDVLDVFDGEPPDAARPEPHIDRLAGLSRS